MHRCSCQPPIIALRNENGSVECNTRRNIIALRNENGSYNLISAACSSVSIIALRNENGSYNVIGQNTTQYVIVALQNGKDTPLIDNIILTIERILHAARRAFQKKCLFSYRDLRWFITR